jgi:hypothetical protein
VVEVEVEVGVYRVVATRGKCASKGARDAVTGVTVTLVQTQLTAPTPSHLFAPLTLHVSHER